MLSKIVAALVVGALSANVAFAGTCTVSDRKSENNKIDVNIKVKNDTDETISVSIWKGTATEKRTVLADQVSVPSDGKEGKTDKNVTSAEFFFSASKKDSDAEALCQFYAYTTSTSSMLGGTKEYAANIDYFECPNVGDFKISCEKGYDKNKDRWNVTYSLE